MAALLELFVLVILSGRIRPHADIDAENIVRPFDTADGKSRSNVQPVNNNTGNGLIGGTSMKYSIRKIDKWAFWVFNFAFIIFNFAYWTKCLAE